MITTTTTTTTTTTIILISLPSQINFQIAHQILGQQVSLIKLIRLNYQYVYS